MSATAIRAIQGDLSLTVPHPPQALRVHRYGSPGPTAVVLHGGPGAPGTARRLASALADPLHVLEPWQRWSSSTPLSVEQHVQDLASVLAEHAPSSRPALVGESWGAMLALAFAARFPERVCAVALVGCGTFDTRSRIRLQETLEQRSSAALRSELAALALRHPDTEECIVQLRRVMDPLYTYERSADADDPIEQFDARGHIESWDDMVRLQTSGRYPEAFATIRCPVLMLHGSYDPHPGPMIRDSLTPYLPQLEYRELERCGHSPWVEQHARARFLRELRGWLAEQLALDTSS